MDPKALICFFVFSFSNKTGLAQIAVQGAKVIC